MKRGKTFPVLRRPKRRRARSLADLARDKIGCHPFCQMSIGIRDTDGPVVEAKFVWELRQTRSEAASVARVSGLTCAGFQRYIKLDSYAFWRVEGHRNAPVELSDQALDYLEAQARPWLVYIEILR
jgi:hypothetical protein